MSAEDFLDPKDPGDNLNAADSDSLQEDREETEHTTWVFCTADDERVCPQCSPLDGSIYGDQDVDWMFRNSGEVDPETIQANLHENCRCVLIAETQDESSLGEEAVLGGLFVGASVLTRFASRTERSRENKGKRRK